MKTGRALMKTAPEALQTVDKGKSTVNFLQKGQKTKRRNGKNVEYKE